VFSEEVWSYLQANTQLFTVFSATFDRPIFFDASDQLDVFSRESRDEFIARLLRNVLQELDASYSSSLMPSWGEAQKYYMSNILFEHNFPFSMLGYSYGPVSMTGGLGVIWQGGRRQPARGQTKAVGPSWRFISDLGNATVASSLPGGPSGNRMDGHLYVSGIQDHLEGGYSYFNFSLLDY
jgi:hypothetical protein